MNGKQSGSAPQALLRYRTFLIASFQASLVLASLVAAWLLRFDFHLPYRGLLFSAAPVLIAIRIVALGRFGLLRGWWRYTGVSDALDILKAVALGSGVFLLIARFIFRVVAFPRTVYVLEAIISLGLLAGVRVFSRGFVEAVRDVAGARNSVLLIGAGTAAQMVIREIRRMESSYNLIGCVDDDSSKWGIKINGVPVMGGIDHLPEILAVRRVDEVLIAIPSASNAQMQRFVAVCDKSKVRFKTVPALRDILTGASSIREFRDVHLEDLLERDAVEIDLEAVRENIEDRAVLVTGAAGSIGSELCRQILSYGPQVLVCLDQSETGIFYLQQELSKCPEAEHVVFCIADIGDRDRMREIFERYDPAVVFHGAAYKHVPLMEQNVQEAVKNNVFALVSLIEIAEASGCESFVVISSDKAVNPTSVMGVTKRIGELIVASRPSRGMNCVSVRFGNVLGSNGSVIPLFQAQLKAGQPLSITHPEIQRFFMTTREAVSLALQAFTIGNRGDTLVLDMGKPVPILQLAKTLIRLSGRSEVHVPIHFTGLRPGEKLTEELFYSTEEILSTSYEKIKRIPSALKNWPLLRRHLAELRELVAAEGIDRIRLKLQEIVPEYSWAGAPSTSRFLRIDQAPRRRKAAGVRSISASQRGIRRTAGIDAD